MRAMISTRMPRRRVPSAAGMKSRTEAAIELVRLEYERERLSQALAQNRDRLTVTLDALRAVDQRIATLLEHNALSGRDPAAPPATSSTIKPRRRNG